MPPEQERFAVVVGVSKYTADSSIYPLFGDNDAKAIAADLVKYAHFPEANVVLVTNDQPDDRKPTRGVILRWLQNLKQLPTSNGLILFFFSGHGLSVADKSFLLPMDGLISSDPDFMADNSISAERVTETLKSSLAKQVIVLIDACRDSLTITKGGSQGNVMTKPFVNSFDLGKLNVGKQAYVTFYSTQIGSSAYQYSDEKMGYFSWALDRAFKNGGYDQTGQMSLGNLITYVANEVDSAVKTESGGSRVQRPFPQISGFRATELIIARRQPAPRSMDTAVPGTSHITDTTTPTPTDKALPQRTITDFEITRSFKTALTQANLQGLSNLKWEIKDGELTLHGQARSRGAKDKLENLGTYIPGVTGINNEVVVTSYTTNGTLSWPRVRALILSLQEQHVPFAWGGKLPKTGFDSSGFSTYVLRQNGLSIGECFSGCFYKTFEHTDKPEEGDIAYIGDDPTQQGALLFFYFGKGQWVGVDGSSPAIVVRDEAGLLRPAYVTFLKVPYDSR